MERLSVYTDYMQTMAFLRASRNRVINTIETANIDVMHGRECVRLCESLYNMHVGHGMNAVELLGNTFNTQDVEATTQAANRLHRHNRQTAKLSKLFEEDISDYHPDPPPDDDTVVTAKPVDPTKPLTVEKFLGLLYRMSTNFEQSTIEAKQRQLSQKQQ